MKISLKNLGPISEWSCTLDDDLMFIYGKNNIGKSYAISTVYLILKNLAFESPLPFRYFYRFDQIFPKSEHVSETTQNKLEDEGQNDIDITAEVEARYRYFLQLIFLEGFQISMKNSFGTVENLNNRMSNERFHIELSFKNLSIHISNDDKGLTIEKVDFHRPIYARRRKIHRRPVVETWAITLSYFKDLPQFEVDLNQFLYSMHVDAISEVFDKVKAIYYLPASRSGLYRALNAFSQILAELAKKRTFLQNRMELPNISEPDLDYFTKLNDIRTRKSNEKYAAVVKAIEDQLLKGQVIFEVSSKRIVFRPHDTDMKLEVLATSSMIAEVSPIVLYLKNIIGTEDDSMRRRPSSESTGKAMVFIEEPEAHLHPEAQIDLMAAFGALVSSDVRLVITSHSNYMFGKLNNLIIAGEIDRTRTRCVLLEASPTGSTSKDLDITRVGVADENFFTASENLYNEKLSRLENLTPEGKE